MADGESTGTKVSSLMLTKGLATDTERVKCLLALENFVLSVSSAQGTFPSKFCLVCFPGFISWQNFPWPHRDVSCHFSLVTVTNYLKHGSLKGCNCIL